MALLVVASSLGSRAEGAGTWALGYLSDRNPDVRAQAIKTLGRMGWPGALEPLIDRIDAEEGAMREAVLDALVVLTGQSPGNASGSWRAWLETEGGPYLRGEKRMGRGDASIRQQRKDVGTTTGSYFGIDQDGEAILYVVDVSKSMQHPAAGRPADKGQGGRPPVTGKGAVSKWVRCRKELEQALQALSPEKTFNIVTFANHVRRFDDRMVKATRKNVARAVEWVGKLDLELETNIYDALDLSFLLAGRGVKDNYYPTVIDTVFLLSDGAPTIPDVGGDSGRVFLRDKPGQILAAVRRWNALGRVRVNTIGIGIDPPPPPGSGRKGGLPARFLRDLATQNRGRFVTER